MEMNLKTSRLAIALFFFTNGFLHANLMARLPFLQQQLGVDNSALGSILFCAAIGALLAMPFAGRATQRYGSQRVATLSAFLFFLFLPCIAFPLHPLFTAALFFVMGASMGSMDVCMNGQAVLLERAWDRPIMSSFHAVFSIGMTLGAGTGAWFSRLQMALIPHLWLMAALCAVLTVWAMRRLVKEKSSATDEDATKSKKGFSLPHPSIIPLGLIAFCCMTGEGSMVDWSAIYMRKVVGQSQAFSALAFGVYATGMTLGRVFGDYATARFGPRRLMTYDAILTILGLGLALSYVSVPSTLIGFFLVGLGVSTIVPIVFSQAGNTPGVNPSAGIAMATSIGYTGFFIGPPAIGFLADAFDLRVGLAFTLGLFVLMLVLIRRQR
jgi:MFS family permease